MSVNFLYILETMGVEARKNRYKNVHTFYGPKISQQKQQYVKNNYP